MTTSKSTHTEFDPARAPSPTPPLRAAVEWRRWESPQAAASMAGRSRGFTLIELLVVIGILSVLAGIALPIFRNTIKDQKKTQAARQVITYIEAARSRAIASKGRVGVMISRRGVGDALQRSYSTQMQLSVAYPPYAGESDNAKALLYNDGTPVNGSTSVANAALFNPAENTLLLKAVSDRAAGRPGPIGIGDPIQFGESGRTVPIGNLSILSGASGALASKNGWIKISFNPRGVIPGTGANTYEFPTSLMNVSASGRQTRYQIYRDPVPSAASPLDMLRGMAIDLNFSGIGRDGAGFSPMIINPSSWASTSAVDFQPIVLMFGPDGRIDFCSSGFAAGSGVAMQDYRPRGLIYLCLGRVDGVFADPAMLFSDTPRERSNIMDPESIWIVINPFNGNTFAAPAAAIAAPDSSLPIATQLSLAVGQSRQFAFDADELTSL